MIKSYKNFIAIRERIQAGEFNNKVAYPSDGVISEVCRDKKKRLGEIIREEARIKDEISKIRRELLQAYNEGERDARESFQKALEKEFDMENHPRRGMLWQRAWDEGHSGGYEEILTIYEGLLELVR